MLKVFLICKIFTVLYAQKCKAISQYFYVMNTWSPNDQQCEFLTCFLILIYT